MEKLHEITKVLLPKDASFSPSQVGAYIVDKSINIVAGPGSGKTTVLIAKIAKILLNNPKAGICVLTHTNVAVDEITSSLRKIGIPEIGYPNFIGTINEFLITFFGRKIFYTLFPEKSMIIVENDQFIKLFNIYFDAIKPKFFFKTGYNNPNPLLADKGVNFILEADNTLTVTSKVKDSYKNQFEDAYLSTLSSGILTHDQSLIYADLYVEKYLSQIREAIKNRFLYVFLDEAQDTSDIQYSILNKFFCPDSQGIQKFGDPYQAIYNIYDGNADAWIPTASIEDGQYVEINETSRFGSSIASLVRKVCVQSYDTFCSLDLIKSFQPYIIIFKEGEDCKEKVKTLISELERDNEVYFKNSKKDVIVAPYHKHIEKISDYMRPVVRKKDKSPIDEIVKFIIQNHDILIEEYNLKQEILKLTSSKVALGRFISELLSVNEVNKVQLNLHLGEILNSTTVSGKTFNFSNSEFNFLKSKLNSLYKMSNITTDQVTQIDSIDLGTIHSVKGETHRSTFLIGSCDIGWGDDSQNLFDLLIPYLLGNIQGAEGITDDNIRDITIQALKFAYVSLSRPQFLAGIIIDFETKKRYSSEIEQLSRAGWVIHE
ncbi:UvrD-helicase domain-containing protein [Trichococcus shcherbakoviae]|uniref:UvrD-like helicase ATP-binding domain-containing protein n=1 Tax=Trichococcus shcherbakoviae TaxID=2094020 RepID=A0A383TF64_9LACT|nr:UvrD-helicase domain-containing protein [Trichococcus shcherbakoviae]SYZ78299.1 Hypothetical protein TART1_1083 [Trichococcus shcherbakoviae]